MSIAEKLTTIANNVQKTIDLNENLENILAGTDTGGKSMYDAFWDAFQMNGNRIDYRYAFSYTQGWTDETFNPKYQITPRGGGNGLRMFSYNYSITDTKVPIAFLKNADGTGYGEISNAFSSCTSLRIIRKIIVDETTRFSEAFERCTALEELYIEGVIAQTGFDVQWSTKLNKASITSIINALSTTTNNLTVTLSKISVDKAFATNDVYSFSTGVNSESTGTFSTNITYPLTISAVNNSVELTSSIWRVRVTYADGTFMYYTDSETTSPKTFEASEENPIVEIEYRNTYITSGSYDFSINYTPGAESQEWLELISTKSNWTINLV